MFVGNSGVFVGRFTDDPKLESNDSGLFYCKFTLARTDGFGDKQKTIYVPFISFSKKAEFISNYFVKGKMVIIGYKIDMTKKYEKDGQIFWPHPNLIVNEIEFAGDSSKQNFSEDPDKNENQEKEPFNDDIQF